ncbi:MAG TPA: hypothetical protein PKE40_10945 [Arachnia sp.]|nr:hypothetical protein [Arachnia sp.]HMT86859.1 hypothetical protein [Arachnia sp.]
MKLTRLVPVAGALALLAACSPAPSTVATVDGVVITSADLQRSVDGCAEIGVTEEALPVKQHVLLLTASELVRQSAEQHGIVIHDGEVRDLAQQSGFADLLGNDECAKLAYPNVALSLLAAELGQDVVIGELQEAQVEVNPRFGQWDTESLGLVGTGSLSVPAA